MDEPNVEREHRQSFGTSIQRAWRALAPCVGVLAVCGCTERAHRSSSHGRNGASGTPEPASADARHASVRTGRSECAVRAANEDLIDDMEHTGGAVPELHGRSGFWFTYHDDTPGAVISPPSGLPFRMAESGDPCRKRAVHVTGGPFAQWGAGLGFGVGNPYDVTRYTGLSFWIKGKLTSTSLVRVSLTDKDTDPKGGLCDPKATDGPNACHDHFGEQFRISEDWSQVTVLFGDLRQSVWGRLASRFDRQTLYDVHFEFPVGAQFDVWLDDVALLSGEGS